MELISKAYSHKAIAFACGFAFALFGYDGTVMSGILANPYFQTQFSQPSSTIVSQITSSFDLGCFITCVAVFIIGDRWSRRKTVMVGCAIHVTGGIIQTCSYSIGQLIAGRLIAGFGNGFITVAIPVWQTECTPSHIRGRFVGLLCAIVCFGNTFTAWTNLGMKYCSGSFSWRFPLALQILLSGGTLIMTPFLPESPRWLVLKGKSDQAKTALKALYNTEDMGEVEAHYSDIKAHLDYQLELQSQSSWKDMFTGKDKSRSLERILLGAGSQFLQQWGGINVVQYYQTPLLENTIGLSSTLAYVLSACNATNNFIAVVIAAYFIIDRVGRKPLMFWGSIVQFFCYLAIVVALSQSTAGDTNRGASIAAVSFMFVYFTVYGLTWCLTPWLYPAEINTLRYRNIGAAISTGTNWIFTYVIVMITPKGTENIGWKYYIIFIVMNLVTAVVVYFFYEETAGLTLEEVDELFQNNREKKSFKEVIPFYHNKQGERMRGQRAANSKEKSEIARIETVP